MSQHNSNYHHFDIYESQSLLIPFDEKISENCIDEQKIIAETNDKKENEFRNIEGKVTSFGEKRMKKSNWTREEDNILKNIVEETGACNWANIAEKLTSRTGKQCRQRWHNHLREGVNKSEWSIHEYWILALCVKAFGKKWSTVSKYLPGRTDNTIKNQWNCKMKMLKNDFSEKIEKLLYNQNLRKKLSKAELILIKEIEKRDDEDKVSLQDQFRINVLRDALDKFERTEEEIREFQILLKDEKEKEDIVEIGWEEKAIEGGQQLFDEQKEREFF